MLDENTTYQAPEDNQSFDYEFLLLAEGNYKGVILDVIDKPSNQGIPMKEVEIEFCCDKTMTKQRCKEYISMADSMLWKHGKFMRSTGLIAEDSETVTLRYQEIIKGQTACYAKLIQVVSDDGQYVNNKVKDFLRPSSFLKSVNAQPTQPPVTQPPQNDVGY